VEHLVKTQGEQVCSLAKNRGKLAMRKKVRRKGGDEQKQALHGVPGGEMKRSFSSVATWGSTGNAAAQKRRKD